MFKRLFQRYSKKTAIIIIALSLILSVSVAGTLAFLVAKTAELINAFHPGEIVLSVDESGVSNNADSDTSVYVRVALVINYQDINGNVSSKTVKQDNDGIQTEGEDYKISALNEGWVEKDGYYYYTRPVNANATTGTLPVTVTSYTTFTPEGADSPVLVAPSGYTLTVTYLATGVQAVPETAVTDAWGGSVSNGIYNPAG